MQADPELEDAIRIESNREIQRGSVYAMALGVLSAIPVLLIALSGRQFYVASTFPLCCAALGLLVNRLAARQRMHSRSALLVFFLFSLVPLGFTALFAQIMDFGAATFFFGPINQTYFIAIVLSGFLVDKNLSRLTGVFSGVFFLVGFMIARPKLELLPQFDATMREDLTSFTVAFVKAMLMVGEGFIVGGLASTARALIHRVRDEGREKAQINSLFGQYVSPEVREKLVREKATLTGERKVVAVLFSDLRGFTPFSESNPPDKVVERLNAYFDAMVRAVTAHGGTVDKFIGDAIMAVFGGLIPLENPALAALDAAVAMRVELRSLNERWRREGLAPLDNGIGLAFGEVLQGPIGSAHRKEFTIIGDVVNTAARLEAATKELKVPLLATGALVDALPSQARSRVAALGELNLRGKELPVAVFGLSG